MKFAALAVASLLLVGGAARADDAKIVAIGWSASIVRAPDQAFFDALVGVDGRVLFHPKLSAGIGFDHMTGENHYELCGTLGRCYQYTQFVRAFGEYHFRTDAVVDPFVRVGVGPAFARQGWWTDRDEGIRTLAVVDARVGVSFVIARTVVLGVHATGALYSFGRGYWSPLGVHLGARF